MSQLIRSFFVFMCFFYTANLFPLIYKMSIWKHAATCKMVYVMYDAHTDYINCQLTHEQSAVIADAACRLKAHVIYEGIADYEGTDPELAKMAQAVRETAGKGLLFPGMKLLDTDIDEAFDGTNVPANEWQQGVNMTLLHLISSKLKPLGVPCINVEFRYHLNPNLAGLTTFGRFVDEIEQAIVTINSFDDGGIYNDFYQERIEHFRDANQDVYEHRQWRVELNPGLPLYQGVLGGTMSRGVTFGLELLESFAAHELCNTPEQAPVFIIMGGLHADSLDDVMEAFGYAQHATIGTTYWNDPCSGRFAFHPIDLTSAFAQGK